MANNYRFDYEEEDDLEYEGVPQKELSKMKTKNRDFERRETRRKNVRSNGFR